MQTILITGGTGYIGSHTTVEFIQAGYQVIIVDNLCNSNLDTLDNIQKITGIKPKFYQIDLTDQPKLTTIFEENKIDSVIHFAGLKAVGESTTHPFLYFENNIIASLHLFKTMEQFGVRKLIFSSSATVYSPSNKSPLTEESSLETTNPYGTSKLIIEKILIDLAKFKNWQVSLLRYFNPIGAHCSGLIGEKPDYPNNLLPFVLDVARGKRKELAIFGNDYNTIDGTGVRDYIHVVDLAQGHLSAYQYFQKEEKPENPLIVNLGTGQGTSVLEIIKLTQKITGKEIPYTVVGRRTGDIATVFAKTEKAKEILNWTAQKSVKEAIKDGWNFISK